MSHNHHPAPLINVNKSHHVESPVDMYKIAAAFRWHSVSIDACDYNVAEHYNYVITAYVKQSKLLYGFSIRLTIMKLTSWYDHTTGGMMLVKYNLLCCPEPVFLPLANQWIMPMEYVK